MGNIWDKLVCMKLLKNRIHYFIKREMIAVIKGKNLAKKITDLNKVPHPKGRKTAQLTKKTLRASGRQKVKLLHQMKVNLLGEKILWFKDNLDSVDTYTPALTINLIERYLGRFDEELSQIELKHSVGKRKGRQHASREDIIKMTIKNEKNEFITSGIDMPDVLNTKQLNLLRSWSGELRFLQNFKLVRYNKGKLLAMKSSVQDLEKKKNKPMDELEEKLSLQKSVCNAESEGNLEQADIPMDF